MLYFDKFYFRYHQTPHRDAKQQDDKAAEVVRLDRRYSCHNNTVAKPFITNGSA